MIFPQSRLLVWFAVVALPFAALAGVYPGATVVAGSLGFLLIALVLADALFAHGGIAGIGLELPTIVRMSKDRDAKLEIRVRNSSQKGRSLRLALPLPREIESSQDELMISLPAGSEWSRIVWQCRPSRRGNFKLDAAFIEAESPLGFWAVRAKLPAISEIRVYPNLIAERKNLAALFLNRGSFGVHAQRQIGKGRDFEKLREYAPGDSFDDIHWKATARRSHPITKVFQIEKTQEIYVIVDASRLSAREANRPGSSVERRGLGKTDSTSTLDTRLSTTVLERFVTAALVLGLAAEKQGDLFGLLTFTDTMGAFLRARIGKGHYGACRDALYTLQPQIVNPDFDEVCSFIRLHLRRRALLVFLTALDDPLLSESFERNAQLLSRQHLVMVNMIQPAGAVPVFSQTDSQAGNDLYACLGGHERWQKLRELGKRLQRHGVNFSVLEQEALCAQVVTQYVNVKKRQMI